MQSMIVAMRKAETVAN